MLRKILRRSKKDAEEKSTAAADSETQPTSPRGFSEDRVEPSLGPEQDSLHQPDRETGKKGDARAVERKARDASQSDQLQVVSAQDEGEIYIHNAHRSGQYEDGDEDEAITTVFVPVFSAPAFFNGNVSRDVFMSQMAALPSSSLMDGLSRTFDLTQQLSKILSMINRLSGETDLVSAVTTIIDVAYSLVQAEKIVVYIVDYTSGEIVNPLPTPGEVSKTALGTGIVGHSAMWGETMNIEDAYKDHRFYPKIDEAKGIKAQSILCIPVRDHLGRTVAVIQAVNKIMDAYTPTVGSFSRDDQSTMELIATCTGNALGKIQLVSKMKLFMGMLKTLSAEIEPDSVIQRIISSSYELLRCERVTLFLVDHEHQILTMAVSKDAEGMSLPMSKGIVGHVSRTGETVNIPNAYDDDRFDPATDKATGFRTRSILCVPVCAPNGQVMAVIQTLNKQFGIFHREDESFLESMAAHAGLALWKSKMYNDNLIARRKSEALLGMVRSVYESDDIRVLFRNILSCVEDILLPERASLVLVDSVTEEMWLAVSEDAEGAKIPKGKGIVSHVISSKESVRVADAYKDERFNSAVDKATGLRTKSILCCPVLDSRTNKSIAAIQVINKGVKGGKEPQLFTTEDQDILEVLCLEVARALKRKSLEMAYSNVINQFTGSASPNEDSIVSSFLMYTGPMESIKFKPSIPSKAPPPPKMMKWPSTSALIEREEYKEWDFDPWSIEETKLLVIIEKFFDELGCLSELKIEQDVFQKFLIQVKDHYKANPFHNFIHAFSVLHQTYLMIVNSPLQSMNRVYILALLLAALGHDLDHPGHTNQFEIYTRSKLALRYNDVSVLENHHASVLIKLIELPDINLFQNMNVEAALSIRKIIVDAIIHTDMARHFEIVTRLKSMCTNSTGFEFKTPAQCQFAVNSILHCADVSGQTLCKELALKWGRLVIEEFNKQATMERERGIPVARFMEKISDEKDQAHLQMNFIDYILKPMWEAVAELLPALKIKHDKLLSMREVYHSLAQHSN